MSEELPVLVAALANEQARALEEASRLGRDMWVELKWPPGQPGPHLLEVYTPTTNEPLRLLAEPLGTSGDRGHVLRLYPWEDEAAMSERAYIPTDARVSRSLAGGRFELISPVGEGSIGAVYRARHTGLGIIVAVKVLHEAFQRDAAFCSRFYAEALALSRLDHSNLVHVYDFGQEADGLLFISMAFVEGQTLRSILVNEKKLDVKRIAPVMLQVCAGLGHAHDRGLLHRDVKPDNVMIVRKEDDDGKVVETVKVLDFGFAVPPSVSADVAQRLAGTPVYMSPEQCRGDELDARSDVYACGVMLYELLTGTVPFLAHDADTIRRMHVHTPPPLVAATIPNIDPRMEGVVQRALAKSRSERPTIQELRADLKALLLPEGANRSSGAFKRKSQASIPTLTTSPSSETPDSARASAQAVADALVHNAGSWLGALAHERDDSALATKLRDLSGAIRILAQRGDARTLRAVSVSGLGKRASTSVDVRDAITAIEGLFVDPQLLAPIARTVLSNVDAGPAVEIIADARVAGAYALYGARTKTEVDAHARIAFVKAMKSLGAAALPVVRAALERIHDGAVSGESQAGADLAEDLLLSLPRAPDEVAGHLVVKYAASPVPTLCRAAARALPRVWGDRSRPILLELLVHHDDSVRLAAIASLTEIGAVDTLAVERLTALESAGQIRTEHMRAAVIAALERAMQSGNGGTAGELMRRINRGA
jgi:serine/threonine-protein kinase